VSFLFERAGSLSAQEMLSERFGRRNGSSTTRVSRDQALRNSAVWACLRLRADLESTMPIDVFRRIGGVQVEQVKPPVLITPGGSSVLMSEHLYSTRVDLDSTGNAVGIIRATDGAGRPSVIELANPDTVTRRPAGATGRSTARSTSPPRCGTRSNSPCRAARSGSPRSPTPR
jgi:hypothetical protein